MYARYTLRVRFDAVASLAPLGGRLAEKQLLDHESDQGLEPLFGSNHIIRIIILCQMTIYDFGIVFRRETR